MATTRQSRKSAGPAAVLRPLGTIMAGLGVAMLLCASTTPLWNFLAGGPRPQDRNSAIGLILSGIIAVIGGFICRYLGRHAANVPIGRREAILMVAAVWLVCGVFGGVPYMMDAGMSPEDALFEAVSGFTTTGATVITDIDGAISRPLLLWRSLTQWLGGMGIIVLFVAFFPNIGVGGKHLYRNEAPGPASSGLRPRIAETSMWLWLIYMGLTIVQILLLVVFGMSWFDATCHAFTTMSTGGFSTSDASLAGFTTGDVTWWESLGREWIVVVFMLIAGVNFSLYYSLFRFGTLRGFLRSVEFRVYGALVIASTAVIWGAIVIVDGWRHVGKLSFLFQSFRDALFLVATTITSTGFGTAGYSAVSHQGVEVQAYFPPVALATMLLLMFVGGCAGSTAGGVKVTRLVLLVKLTWAQLRKSFRPHVVHVVRMDNKPVELSAIHDVAAFLLIFLACMAGGVLLITFTDGVSVPKAFGAMLTTISNMGPGPFHSLGPAGTLDIADNFASYSPVAKLVFSLFMVLGRLEFFTLLAMLLPDFWRR